MPKKKKNKNSYTALYFFAAAIITSVAVRELMREAKRKKAEDELLAYEVW